LLTVVAMTWPRFPSETPAEASDALMATIAFQLAPVPPLPLTRGVMLRSGVITGISESAGAWRSKVTSPVACVMPL
jgi:hypothetical protein